jgi:purine-binding chemotaxis protein CheW
MSALHILFKVGGAEYVVPSSLVAEVESFTSATRVPGAPAHVIGLVQIRGRVLPVIDLRARFGLEAVTRDLASRVIVVKDEGRQVGLLADEAREVIRLDDNAFRPPPPVVVEQSGGFVDAIAVAGPRMVMRINARRIIGTDPSIEEERDGSQAQR